MPTPIKLPAEVENIIHHADGVKSFIMRPLKSCPNFKPGQFLHLAIDEYDPSFHWPESRVFSIANSPTRRDKLRITFSVKGEFTERMYSDVKQGDVLWLKLPYGCFSFSDNNGKKIVLIAGGTGITPFVSFLEYTVDKRTDTKIQLYYGVKSPEYLIFDSFLEECDNIHNEFGYHIYTEQDSHKCNLKNVRNGMLSIETIMKNNKNNQNSIFYLSGPQQMIGKFREEMIKSEIVESNIIADEWE